MSEQHERSQELGSNPKTTQLPIEVTFRHAPASGDPWDAYRAAEGYCLERGWSVGSMQRGSPTAVFEGYCYVSKWRNLSRKEQGEALAVITSKYGTFRDCDVILRILRKEEVAA